MSDQEQKEFIFIPSPPKHITQYGSPVEITITVKDENNTFKFKELEYREFKMNQDDLVIRELIDEAVKRFQGEPETIRISSKFVVV